MSVDKPKLLRIPTTFHSVEELCGAAVQLDLTGAILISEREGGAVVFLATDDVTCEHANWLCDRLKLVMLDPAAEERMKV